MDTNTTPPSYDAIIIGAGFAGIRMLHELLQNKLTAHVFEAGTGVGGTWYWNRYPGARTDSESWGYCYQFSKALCDDWTWSERLPSQSEVLEYLEHVTDRFDLRRHMSFSSRVASARYDEVMEQWTVCTTDGQTAVCKYLVSATGVLSVPKTPEFDGIEDYRGELYLAPLWPKDKVSFAGKKVAIIGAAATAVQLLPIVAKTAEQVYYFQRTPNYVLPGRNYLIDEHEAVSLKVEAPATFDKRRAHMFGLPMEHSGRTYDSVNDEERRRIFEAGWEAGGFHFCFETFDDILTDQRSNDAAAEFVREKIRSIVHDPATAELLCPDYSFFAKRPPSGHFYYEAFNRSNVALVNVKDDPIQSLTQTGVATRDQIFDVDMVVLATGFDAGTGPLMAIDLQGRDGVTIADKWQDGPSTYMGLMVEHFPNMFMIMGPQSPFGNIPTIIEDQVDWIAKVINRNESGSRQAIEPTADAARQWGERLQQIYAATLLSAGVAVQTWFLGANIAGKPNSVMFFFGGVGAYLDQIHASFDEGLPGLTWSQHNGDAQLQRQDA